MDEKGEDSKSNDRGPAILSTEDQEIEERKPPNDKILDYKIIEEENNHTDS